MSGTRPNEVELPGEREWLLTNDGGSFALGCADRLLRRKYHGLLTVREPGRGDPWSVLAEVAETVVGRGAAGDAVHQLMPFVFGVEDLTRDNFPNRPPDAAAPVSGFELGGPPTHTHVLPAAFAGAVITRRVELVADRDEVHVHYRFEGVSTPFRLELRPLLRCRGFHELTVANPFLNGTVRKDGETWVMRPYLGMPELRFVATGEASFAASGSWYENVAYAWENERGYDSAEDLYVPGVFEIQVDGDGAASFALGLHAELRLDGASVPEKRPPSIFPQRLQRAAEALLGRIKENIGIQPSNGFGPRLVAAARQFVVQLESGHRGIIAGYPWFGEWGRDTLIALPGTVLATGDTELAVHVLESLADRRVNGLIPNLPASGDVPANSNSVDASLLFVRAVQWLVEEGGLGKGEEYRRLMPVVCEILDALDNGADARVSIDHALGIDVVPGDYALTWMDAMVDGHPVTGRHHGAVDLDALLFNAVTYALAWDDVDPLFVQRWRPRLEVAHDVFMERYWLSEQGFLADGWSSHAGPNPELRPNQLWALALPHSPVPHERALEIIEKVRAELLTPAGLRTLANYDAGYIGRYEGNQPTRDRAYHQGTVWPWPLGIYAEAVHRRLGAEHVASHLADAFAFLGKHLDEGCIGQIAEVFHGDAPHVAGGTPAQAWSVTEVYRAWKLSGH